jgi:hypothetical protein
MAKKHVRITHQPSGLVLAEGPLGWGITPFEGNFYVQKRFLRGGTWKAGWIPGLCIYKFFYIWLQLVLPSGEAVKELGWMYFLPNPLFPFIWFRVAIPGSHPQLRVERFGDPDAPA